MKRYHVAMIVRESVNVRFGQRVAELRHQANMSQEELALKSGVNRTFMGTIERGEKSPSLRTIFKLAIALGVTLKELFDYD